MATLVFDFETGPVPEEQLQALYREPTFEEFAADCDQRWKPETKAAKFEEAKATGWQKFVSRAALSPVTGLILAVGLRRDDKTVILGADGESETDQIEAFWNLVQKYAADNGRMVGFNIHGFDLPFIIRRSWFHQIPVPEKVVPVVKDYFPAMFIDLMKQWGCGSREFIGLNDVCQFFGLGQKPDGVNGGDFAGLWNAPETRQQAASYLVNDLDMTWRLAERMGVIL